MFRLSTSSSSSLSSALASASAASGTVASPLSLSSASAAALRRLMSSVAPATGFEAVGVRCGIKKKASASDFALFRSTTPCSAAGVFTQNQFCAAPVLVSRSTLASHPHAIQGVAINAGCANACTGEKGLEDAKEMSKMAKEAGIDNAFIMSTGVIGPFLPMDKIRSGYKSAVEALPAARQDPVQGWSDAAEAIMTTDTHPKVLHEQYELEGKKFTLSGVCKGAGMIHPNMATMLAVVATDLSIHPKPLQTALRYAADRSFNSISIDGDTSTNDSLVVLANGQAEAFKGQHKQGEKYVIDSEEHPAFEQFQTLLTKYCINLAHKIVRDGEGATKFVTVSVTGGRSYLESKQIANSISTSMLVKTALFGQDANWGRILCATGYAGIPIDVDRVNLWIRPSENAGEAARKLGPLHLVKGGQPFDANDDHATALFKEKDLTLHLDLGLGKEDATVWTCDLSLDYVNINGSYRS